MLNIENLVVDVKESGKKVLKDFSLDIKEGEIHAIMGPNGVGKSTLAKVIMGDKKYLVKSGSIKFNNEEMLDKEKVMYVQFEDLVYNYTDTLEIVSEWLKFDIKHHSKFKKYFDPSKSINNTQTWKRFTQSRDEVAYIGRELKEYLYDFPEVHE